MFEYPPGSGIMFTLGDDGNYHSPSGGFMSPQMAASAGINTQAGSSDGGGTGSLTWEQIQERDRQLALYDIISRSTPSQSFSSSINQSLADQRVLDLQYKQLLEDIRGHDIAAAQDDRNFEFLKDKFAVETESNNKRDALATQSLMEQVRARVESNNLQRQSMLQQAQQFERQMQYDAAVEQSRQAEQQRQFNVEQGRQVANDIATTAAQPGDVGKNAALLTSLGAPNPISSAIAGGQDLRTQNSLAPLDMLLGIQKQLQGGGILNQAMKPGQGGVGPIDGGAGFGGFATGSAEEAQARQAALNNQLQGQLNAILTGNPSTVGAGTPIEASLAQLANTPGSAIGQNGLNFFALPGTDASKNGFQGAMAAPVVPAANGFDGTVTQPTVFLAGEGGQPENVNIQPAGDAQPVGVQRGDAGQVASPQLQQKPSLGAPQPQTQTPQALNFLNSALQRLFQNTPFSQIPTPIGLSAPGTSQYLQQMGASIASLGLGVDPGLFLNEAMGLRPTGIGQGITRSI